MARVNRVFARAGARRINRLISRSDQISNEHKNCGVSVQSLQDPSAAQLRNTLLVLFGAVGLVLLIACANIVNLLLVRNAAREREVALRIALGASPWRLIRQLLTESTLLSMAGGALGLFLAMAGLKALLALSPQTRRLAGQD